jgi:peptide-N-glycosidase F-like protein
VKKVFCFCVILLAFFASSCKYANPKYIKEGIIDYDVKPVDESNPMAGLAPGKMTVKFKDNMIAAEMSTMGVFTTTFIFNPVKKTLTQLVKVFDVKQACIDDEKTIAEENKTYQLAFEETDEKKEIAGYKCKKMIATMADDPSNKFDVWYTEELNINNPNANTPYDKIKGMLMQYRLKKFGLELEFTAKGVEKEKISNDEFELPAYYKVISKKEMDEFFKSIQ